MGCNGEALVMNFIVRNLIYMFPVLLYAFHPVTNHPIWLYTQRLTFADYCKMKNNFFDERGGRTNTFNSTVDKGELLERQLVVKFSFPTLSVLQFFSISQRNDFHLLTAIDIGWA